MNVSSIPEVSIREEYIMLSLLVQVLFFDGRSRRCKTWKGHTDGFRDWLGWIDAHLQEGKKAVVVASAKVAGLRTTVEKVAKFCKRQAVSDSSVR